ncbi:MAG: insulinase family protein [Elusimicrobiota bacterium]|nr:insulinase family protein [Elusimicrobiota bacterium]
MNYKNGLKSILIKNPNSLSASVVVFVRTGAVNEKPEQAGLSHFLEHLIFKGSKNYPGDLMSRNVENLGGYINAATSKEWTMYYINIQKDGVEESVKMLADAIENPIFPQNEIDRERKVVIEEIQRHSDNPISVLYEKHYELLYPQSTLKNSIIGTENVISNISATEIYNYHKTHYIPENMVVAVSGNFDENKISKIIDDSFGKIKKTYTGYEPIFLRHFQEKRDWTHYGKVEVGYMISGFLGPDIDDDNIYTADIAAHILGGSKSSRLYRKLYEEKHIVYSINSGFMSEKGNGNIYIISIFNTENIEYIKEEIATQLNDIISNGISNEELERAKISAKTDWSFSKETPFDVANTLAFWQLLGNPDFPKKYIEKIENLTSQDISKFFEKHYSLSKLTNAAIVPKEKVTLNP